ncbi:MAG: peroxiredoxin [Pseudomonadota bacterium]
MALSVGSTLPDATFFHMTGDGPQQASTADIFDGKTVVAFAVPGAFTPTCHMKHMPGFVTHADAFKAKGVDSIVCLTVNDPFVAGAWSEATGAGDAVQVIADADGSFTKAAGMDFDGSAVGLGVRSLRYAMIVKDGTVSAINIADSPGEAEKSSAEALVAAL